MAEKTEDTDERITQENPAERNHSFKSRVEVCK